MPIHSPTPAPVQQGEQTIVSALPPGRSIPPSVTCSRLCATRGEGHCASPTKRPAAISRFSGAAPSSIQARSLGSFITPASRPFNQWSHQRVASCRKPIAGPGLAVLRIEMRPGSNHPEPRDRQTFEQTGDGVGVGVGPTADNEHRALDSREILAHGAVPPVGVAPLMPQPQRRPERHGVEPANQSSRQSSRNSGSGGRA